MQQPKKLSPVIVALIVIVLIGVAVAAVVIAKQPEETSVSETTQVEDTTPATDDTETNSDSTAASEGAATYKDGTYTETGRYASPGGAESIEVTITVANDIITSATVVGDATSGESEEYQSEFVSGYKSLVVGKDIDEVSLSRVAGSSLTSTGFNAAIKLIKADAKA